MAFTAYTGPMGSGKSHALVKDVIVPAVMAGRCVRSNIDGLNPNAVRAYCLERPDQWKVESADKLGEVVLFHGQDAQADSGFWPTEETEKQGLPTVVRPGDLVVFDEWAMYWPTGDKSAASVELESFMRWHRHLTHPETGVACDLAVATQAITDFSRRHRPLLGATYLFKKLTAVGKPKSYTWHSYQGRFQKNPIQTGHGDYDPAIFPLYASSSGASAGNHTELRTNKKETIWTGWRAWAVIVGAPLVMLVGAYFLWGVFTDLGGDKAGATPVQVAGGAPSAPGAPVASPSAPPPSPWRIVGQVQGDDGTRVIVSDEHGGVRIMRPDTFQFDQGQPVSGLVDGRQAVAEDRLPVSESKSLFGGELL